MAARIGALLAASVFSSCALGPLIAEDGSRLRVEKPGLNLRISSGELCHEIDGYQVELDGGRVSYSAYLPNEREVKTTVDALGLLPHEQAALTGWFFFRDDVFGPESDLHRIPAGQYGLRVTAMHQEGEPVRLESGDPYSVVRSVYIPREGESPTLEASAFGCEGHFNGALDVWVLTSEGPDIVDYEVLENKLPKECEPSQFSVTFQAEQWTRDNEEGEPEPVDRPFDVSLELFRPGAALSEGIAPPIVNGTASHPSDGEPYLTDWRYACDTVGTHTVRVQAIADTGATTEFISMLHCLRPTLGHCAGSDGETYALDSCHPDDWTRLDRTCVRDVGIQVSDQCASICPDACVDPERCP